jgi:protein-disulfide isomerase
MSSRTAEKSKRRAEREAREREAARAAARRRRLGILGGVLLAAAAVVAVLVIVSAGGGGKKGAGAGGALQGQTGVRQLFAGIPQRGVSLGRPNAPVTMIEFGDLQCPICAEYARQALPTLVARYVRTGKVRLELHLIDIIGPDSQTARQMATAAGLQNRTWQYSELFYLNQGGENSGYVTTPFLRRIGAGVAGLDVGRALSQRSSAPVQAVLGRNDGGAQLRGVNATPTFFAGRTGGVLTPLQAPNLQPGDFTPRFDQLLRRG